MIEAKIKRAAITISPTTFQEVAFFAANC